MKMTWKGFLRREAGRGTAGARLVFPHALLTPGRTRANIADHMKRNTIAADAGQHLLARVAELSALFHTNRPEVL